MYTVTFMGKKSEVSAMVFWSLAVPMFLAFLAMVGYSCLMVYLSTTMLEDYTGFYAFLWGFVLVFVLGSVTINGEEKAFLHKYVRSSLGFSLVVCTIWYQYAVSKWEPLSVWLLAVPVVAGLLYKVSKQLTEGTQK